MANPTTYQRVNTATDYDSVGFPHYLKFDGVDDGFSATFPAGTLGSNMDCFMLVRKDSVTNNVWAYDSVTGGFFAVSSDGATSSPGSLIGSNPINYYVNGTIVGPGGAGTQRDHLHDALTIGEWHVLEVTGLDLSGWGSFKVGDYGGGFNINGAIAEVILAPAQSAEERTKAREYLAAKAGIVLP